MPRKALLRRISDVDLRLLRVFRTVADCGGLAASEFELNIGKSTISKHISDLEARLGLNLCRRGPGGFSLTPEGAEVLQAAARLMSAIDAFQAEIDSIHQDLTGVLKLALFDHSASNPIAHMDEAVRKFGEAAPLVTLEISMEPPNVIENGVIDRRFDVGVVPRHRRSSSLSYMDLYSEEMILYCGRGHPLYEDENQDIDLDELRKYDSAGFDFNSPNMMVSQQMGLNKTAIARDELALALLIKSGRYIGYLPSHLAQRYVDSGALKPVLKKKTLYRSITTAITRNAAEKNRKLKEFIACLAATHPEPEKSAPSAVVF